jgi:hypothetical protein
LEGDTGTSLVLSRDIPFINRISSMAVGRADCGGSIERKATMSLDDNDPTMDENDPSKRSERKRQREKQRRFDLSAAFDELGLFIAQVDPEDGDGDLDAKKKRKRTGEGDDPGGATRLDLIGRALKLMRRLHAENEERKAIIATMRERGGAGMAGPNENVSTYVLGLAIEASRISRDS